MRQAADSKGASSKGGFPPRRWLLALAFAMFCFSPGAPAPAQAQALPGSEPESTPAEEAAADPLGRSTPAGTVAGFIEAISARDYERAGQFLDLSGVSSQRRGGAGARLAQNLQQALDRAGNLLPPHRLSDDPAGQPSDNPDPDLEEVGSLGAGEHATALLLRRIEDAGARYWAFASETITAASAISAGAGAALAEAWLPDAATSTTLLGAPLSHWLTLLAGTAAMLALGMLVLRLVLVVVGRSAWRESWLQQFLGATHWPLSLLFAFAVVSALARPLGVSIVARHSYGWMVDIIAPLAVAWLVLRLVDAVSREILERFERRSQATATAVVRFAGRVAKAMIVALAVMAVLDAFGFDVTAVLAALGIGGLALALGAQRTVENLIASVSIISDRPFRVGDFCSVGDTLGTVEDIGMRSTRIRTLSRTVVTIPNSNLVSSAIENFADRDRFWFSPMLHVSTGTPPERVRALLGALRAVLEGDERLLGRTARVRLLVPASDRLPIEVFGYVLAADYDAFLEVQEDLTLKLLDAVAGQGLVLAPPTVDLRGLKQVTSS